MPGIYAYVSEQIQAYMHTVHSFVHIFILFLESASTELGRVKLDKNIRIDLTGLPHDH